MHGRSRLCLLAIFFLAPGLFLLHGQTAQPVRQIAPEPVLPRLPGQPQPPVVGPSSPLPHPPISSPQPIRFPQIASAAGTIFSGTVISVAHLPASRGRAVGAVAITFHVENAIRGVTPGKDFTIRQWIGLWSGGQRYQVGERLLLFLYPPSRLGLTSIVAGALGRFAVDGWGHILISPQQLSVLRTNPTLGGKSRVSFSDIVRAVRLAQTQEQDKEERKDEED